MARRTTIHFGEFDELSAEDGTIVFAAMSYLEGKRPSLQSKCVNEQSIIDRTGGPSRETDLFEIERFLQVYRYEAEVCLEWLNTLDPMQKNADGIPIAKALRIIRHLCVDIRGACSDLERALKVGDTSAAALIGLKLSAAIGRKRFLADDMNFYMTGVRSRRKKVREKDLEVAKLRRFARAEARQMKSRNSSLSNRDIAERLAERTDFKGRSPETIRKYLSKKYGAL
ncbi:hypothetical protein L5876_07495 [Hyphobacterium sp. SN044]|uniref:hypothetical protein n=1 Tax=Hyphobacterium sp. SN044 TaxID=2912575 RepID=UPI001F18DA98|nr:hypothetical protein [Hyphobacterium sp. SN044]MCF8879652.1 hypothetical protein [Hyphobacterium sp. SN044]